MGELSPLPRRTPRFFAAGGLDFTTEDPLWSPFSRGTKEPDQRSGLRHSRESGNDATITAGFAVIAVFDSFTVMLTE